nr:6-phosphogluconolactonase [Pacificimonas pallii]
MWESESADEFAAAVAGDISFIIDQALDARREAIVALPVEDFLLPAYALVAEGKRNWRHVIIVPSYDALIAVDDPKSKVATLARIFMAKGARVLPLGSENADYRMAGAAADARLQDLGWPFDLVLLTMSDEGDVSGLVQGPDLDEALTADDDRRAYGMAADDGEAHVTISRKTIVSARTLMFALQGASQSSEVATAVEGGDSPAAKLLAGVTVPIDAHVLLD